MSERSRRRIIFHASHLCMRPQIVWTLKVHLVRALCANTACDIRGLESQLHPEEKMFRRIGSQG